MKESVVVLYEGRVGVEEGEGCSERYNSPGWNTESGEREGDKVGNKVERIFFDDLNNREFCGDCRSGEDDPWERGWEIGWERGCKRDNSDERSNGGEGRESRRGDEGRESRRGDEGKESRRGGFSGVGMEGKRGWGTDIWEDSLIWKEGRLEGRTRVGEEERGPVREETNDVCTGILADDAVSFPSDRNNSLSGVCLGPRGVSTTLSIVRSSLSGVSAGEGGSENGEENVHAKSQSSFRWRWLSSSVWVRAKITAEVVIGWDDTKDRTVCEGERVGNDDGLTTFSRGDIETGKKEDGDGDEEGR